MNASVVIPTYNKCTFLEKTLQSLFSQKDAPRFEIVVVDDGSTDDTSTTIEELSAASPYPLRCVRNPRNLGRARTRNVGLAHAQGDIVVFVDDDCPTNEEFVGLHVRACGPGKIVRGKCNEFAQNYTAPSVDLSQKEKLARMTGSFHWPFQGNVPLAWLNFATGNLSAYRQDVLRVGAFDEHFSGWGCEDTELGYRMSKMGNAFYVYEPRAENFHLPHPRSTTHYREKYESWRYFYQKHPFRDVELLLLFGSKRISFMFYRSQTLKSLNRPVTSPIFDEAYYHVLQSDFLLADSIVAGANMALCLSDTARYKDESKSIIINQAEYQFELDDVEREILFQLDGGTLLADAIHAVCHDRPDVPPESGIRAFVAGLVADGVLKNAASSS